MKFSLVLEDRQLPGFGYTVIFPLQSASVGHFLHETGILGVVNWYQPSKQATHRPSTVNSSPKTHYLTVVLILTGA
jgi:hypothetical protein